MEDKKKRNERKMPIKEKRQNEARFNRQIYF